MKASAYIREAFPLSQQAAWRDIGTHTVNIPGVNPLDMPASWIAHVKEGARFRGWHLLRFSSLGMTFQYHAHATSNRSGN